MQKGAGDRRQEKGERRKGKGQQARNRQRKVDRISFAVMLACQKRTTMTTSGAETRAATTRLSGTSRPYGNHLPAHYEKGGS